MLARAYIHENGDVDLSFPFNRELIDELKSFVPGKQRRYDPDTKTWTVSPDFAEWTVGLLKRFYPYAQVRRWDDQTWQQQQFHQQAPPQPPPPPNPKPSDPFAALHLLPSAPRPVIEAAYKALARLHHPDLVPADEKEHATARMAEINRAVDRLRERVSA